MPRRCRDDHVTCPFGKGLQKYWDRRYDYFSRFDEGIQIDAEALFSVKPEAHAIEIASRMLGNEVIDGFCGVGGISIALARLGKKVTAIDTSKPRLEMAKENARIYDCLNNIEFIHDDFLEVCKRLRSRTSIYLDPPWGGPDYRLKEKFCLEDFSPNGDKIIRSALTKSHLIGLSVPNNFTLDSLRHWELDFSYKISRSIAGSLFATIYINSMSHAKAY